MTADEKNSILNRDNLQQDVQMQLSQKEKFLPDFLLAFSKLRCNFEHFQQKDEPHRSWTYRLRETSWDKCLKSPVSEDPCRSNMVNVPKHYWDLNDNIFTKFIEHCEGNSVKKVSLSEIQNLRTFCWAIDSS